jgi:hypothetical protein
MTVDERERWMSRMNQGVKPVALRMSVAGGRDSNPITWFRDGRSGVGDFESYRFR